MGFLLFIVALIALIVYLNKKEKKLRGQFNIPSEAKKIFYYGGYTINLKPKIYFWNNDNTLFLCDPKTSDRHLTISKDNILNFSLEGEYHRDTKVTGGGASVGGAIVGGAIAGPVGAIVGGRKKTKTKTTTVDTRKVILKFKENNIEKGMILDYGIYDKLCFMCPEKKIA